MTTAKKTTKGHPTWRREAARQTVVAIALGARPLFEKAFTVKHRRKLEKMFREAFEETVENADHWEVEKAAVFKAALQHGRYAAVLTKVTQEHPRHLDEEMTDEAGAAVRLWHCPNSSIRGNPCDPIPWRDYLNS